MPLPRKAGTEGHHDGAYEALAQSAPDAILTIDENSTILSANAAVERIFGYPPEEIVGRALTILMPNRHRARHDSGIERYMSTGHRNIPWTGVQLPALTRDGREIPVEISFGEFRDAQGRRIFSGFVRDISDRVRQQEALTAREAELQRINTELEARAREERALRTLAQSIAGATRVDDVMHRIAEAAAGVSGAAGAFVEQIVAPDETVEVVAGVGTKTLPTGQRVSYPGSLTREMMEQREPRWLHGMRGIGAATAPALHRACPDCSALVVPLHGDGRALGALVLLRMPDESAFEPGIVDRVRTIANLASLSMLRLSALTESERRREEAEAAVRSRDEVLSIVSHDLRNPVNTVAMSAAVLNDPDIQLGEDERRVQFGIIARSAQRMNRLIQDLLDVARIEGGRFAIAKKCEDPGALVTETCDAFRQIAAEKSLELTCEIERDLPHMALDRDRIVQALSNFLSNAIKFTPNGGRVTIGAQRDADGGVRLFVTDTGSGIAPDELPHMFDRFWQARRTAHLGAGLGLAIARGIATAHGASVAAESQLGRGSTFSLTFPDSARC